MVAEGASRGTNVEGQAGAGKDGKREGWVGVRVGFGVMEKQRGGESAAL